MQRRVRECVNAAECGTTFPSMDALLAWLIERLGPRAVKSATSVMVLISGLATLAFAIVLIVILSR